MVVHRGTIASLPRRRESLPPLRPLRIRSYRETTFFRAATSRVLVVLAEKVGKKRNFVPGFLLSLVTALVYAVYWNYRAHNEVYRQFELQKEDRDEGVVWFILGIILPPFLLAYWWIMVSNVQYVRDRLRLPRGISPGRFVTLTVLAFGSYIGALLLVVYASTLQKPTATPEQAQTALAAVGGAVALLVLTLAFGGVAYRRLQADLNEVWDAYDRRIMELRAPAAAPPQRLAAPPGPAMAAWAESPVTYYADLKPRDPPQPPPP